MKVRDVMSSKVESCTPNTDLATAAMMMWKGDCGIIPVVAPGTRKLEGVITDRDICMALATTGRRPDERLVGEVMARNPSTVTADDNVHEALHLMGRDRVRRLPVVDRAGALTGLVSINDVVLNTGRARTRPVVGADDVLGALRQICAHRAPAEAEPAGEVVGANG